MIISHLLALHSLCESAGAHTPSAAPYPHTPPPHTGCEPPDDFAVAWRQAPGRDRMTAEEKIMIHENSVWRPQTVCGGSQTVYGGRRDSVGPPGDLYSSLRAYLMVADRPEWFCKKKYRPCKKILLFILNVRSQTQLTASLPYSKLMFPFFD